ncbi:MAG: hypothetical protein LQ340_000638 [Diploschistes diacapsis]|nr:MAG: hypothetical protein LQ340_000638 [Diploschistes diacapsis]
MTFTRSTHQLPTIPYPFPRSDPNFTVEEEIHAELVACLSGQSSRSSRAEAEAFTALVTGKAAQGEDYTRGLLYNFWTIILTAVGAIPPMHGAQETLVDLVMSLPSIDTDVSLEHGLMRVSVWKDMPIFEESVNEILRTPGHLPSTDPTEIAKSTHWASLNRFAAHTAAQSSGNFDFLSWALVACATAFEQPHPAVAFEYHLLVAADWLEQCGDLLVAGRWRDRGNGSGDDDDEGAELARLPPQIHFPAGPLLGGGDDFNRRRWDFWSERLRAVERGEGSGVEHSATAREATRRVLGRMEDVTGRKGRRAWDAGSADGVLG